MPLVRAAIYKVHLLREYLHFKWVVKLHIANIGILASLLTYLNRA